MKGSGNTAEVLTPPALMSAFEKFSEASHRLEARYAALLQETEELRAALKEKDELMKRKERLAVLGETAAALAHEVRNPLGALSLFLSMLKEDIADRPQALFLVDEMGKSIANLNGVVSNILHFAKNRSITKAPLNVQSVALEVCTQVGAQMSAGGTVKTDFAAAPFILGDEHGLRRVFFNLITNAAQAVEYRGAVRVGTRGGDKDDLVIEVSDDGPGIPDAIVERLFEPFVTGRSTGTGLGLSIVRQIIEQHGGVVKAWNDGGAHFELRLPRK